MLGGRSKRRGAILMLISSNGGSLIRISLEEAQQEMRARWALSSSGEDLKILRRRTSPWKARKLREEAAGPGWSREQWGALLAEYGNRCLLCGSEEKVVPDHVIPLVRGGAHRLDNIQPLCWKCNFRKGTKIADYRASAKISRLTDVIL
jgi:5-methylcytosine-specific restriction endonuclease McrA